MLHTGRPDVNILHVVCGYKSIGMPWGSALHLAHLRNGNVGVQKDVAVQWGPHAGKYGSDDENDLHSNFRNKVTPDGQQRAQKVDDRRGNYVHSGSAQERHSLGVVCSYMQQM